MEYLEPIVVLAQTKVKQTLQNIPVSKFSKLIVLFLALYFWNFIGEVFFSALPWFGAIILTESYLGEPSIALKKLAVMFIASLLGILKSLIDYLLIFFDDL
jgi:formate/nitrite transporter FocA (FNT family)